MVKISPNSPRMGTNLRPVSAALRKKRALSARVPPKRRVIPEATKTSRQISKYKFEVSQSNVDLQMTAAVKEALSKLRSKCLQVSDYNNLLRCLSDREKRSRPKVRGAKCIAIPQGSKSALPCWEPAIFECEYFPNWPLRNVTFVILKRTEWVLSADNRLSPYFCVLNRHCFNVPRRFSPEFDLNFSPNTGLYVIRNATDDRYVGWSKNIRKRIHFHNQGLGATFTKNGQWWRVLPLLDHPQQNRTPGSRFTREALEVEAQRKVAPRGRRVAGGGKSQSQ